MGLLYYNCKLLRSYMTLFIKGEIKMTENIKDLSGNIKLRLPKSLHGALVRQSRTENVSLNQLCLMYLSSGISSSNLGTAEFDHRLELIAGECLNDEKRLFVKLGELNDAVEALKPHLLQELKAAIDENRRQMRDYIEILRYTYPIYHGDLSGQKLPMLKVPSAKISLRPIGENFLDAKEIEKLVHEVCPNALVAYGDYDFYLPLDIRLSDRTNGQSIAVNICCKFQELQENIKKIKFILEQSKQKEEFITLIKPCYLQESTSILLKEKYGME